MTILDDHEQAVLIAATARLVPGPDDDPAESSPGAREAGATDYIVGLLGALQHDPPRIYAGGPFSAGAGPATDDFWRRAERHDVLPAARTDASMAAFLPLSPAVRAIWQRRLDDLAAVYHAGLRRLDELAGGDFAGAAPEVQDAALADDPSVDRLPAGCTGFTDLLLQHTIEACYSVPAYGGNRDGVMWAEIGFPGDVQPRGYDDEQVSDSDGPDPYEPAPIVAELLALITSSAPDPPLPPPAVEPP